MSDEVLGRATSIPARDRATAAIERVAARYTVSSRFARGFVRGKLRGDPVVSAILALGAARPFGQVADLGCGRGQLGLLLLELGLAESVAGLDLDGRKIAHAAAAAGASEPPAQARFTAADLAASAVPDCDTALLIDVLLLLPEAAQDALLMRAASATRERILIRAFDPDRGWRSRFGLAVERLRIALGADPAGGPVRPRPIAVLAAPLRAAGFAITVTPCWGATPLPNVLLVAERGR